MRIRPKYIFGIICLLHCCAHPLWGKVNVRGEKESVHIENGMLEVRFALNKGTFSAIDLKNGEVLFSDATTRINDLYSSSGSYHFTWDATTVKDALGEGEKIVIEGSSAEGKNLLIELSLYDNSPFIVLRAGLHNKTGESIRVERIHPMTEAHILPGSGILDDPLTLDGVSSNMSPKVKPGLKRESINNLMLTCTAGGRRRTMVAGGLTYHDYAKYVLTGPAGALPLRYEDCGKESGNSRSIELIQGRKKIHTVAQRFMGLSRYCTSVQHEDEIIYEFRGLDPEQDYTLGIGWWDYEELDPLQSVFAFDPEKPDQRFGLIRRRILPNYTYKYIRIAEPEEWALAVPREAYKNGSLRIAVTNDYRLSYRGTPYNVPYATLNEIWLWEGKLPHGFEVPYAPSLSEYHLNPCEDTSRSAGMLDLMAHDPVGRKVDPGTDYLPEDYFYLDLLTTDPFESLENYALAIRKAQKVRNNLYTFPTQCGWYVEFFTRGPRINNTTGIIEELKAIRESGFLDYSPVATRLVPDKYNGDTEQGWWDDEHWRKFRHYTEPYETTQKWCEGVTKLGGIPFTYFQASYVSEDFARAHPEYMMYNHTLEYNVKGKTRTWFTYDYSDPGFLSHLEKVWENLRDGGMQGVMFDYPEQSWLPLGGFEDEYATAASVYRNIFRMAKEGLGPGSYIHERNITQFFRPVFDISVGLVESQRVAWDVSHFDLDMVTKSGLRWYKNRTLFSYDTDSKTFFHRREYRGQDLVPLDTEMRRKMLTMLYVTNARFLMADSFTELSNEIMHDLSRTFPYHETPRSARPVDMLSGIEHPRIYDFRINENWHQLTLLNADPVNPSSLQVPLSITMVDGGLELDPEAKYHFYDFWNDRYAGLLGGDETLTEELRAGEARMLSLHRQAGHPQVISTDRHIMQGYVEMRKIPEWTVRNNTLTGVSELVPGEPYTMIIALNGFSPVSCKAGKAECSIKQEPSEKNITRVIIKTDKKEAVEWSIVFN